MGQATEKQVNFTLSLLARVGRKKSARELRDMESWEISELIDRLKKEVREIEKPESWPPENYRPRT